MNALVADRPNLNPTGVGHSGTDIDMSILETVVLLDTEGDTFSEGFPKDFLNDEIAPEIDAGNDSTGEKEGEKDDISEVKEEKSSVSTKRKAVEISGSSPKTLARTETSKTSTSTKRPKLAGFSTPCLQKKTLARRSLISTE